jgi:membrane protease YdiL (CAAX protease family)
MDTDVSVTGEPPAARDKAAGVDWIGVVSYIVLAFGLGWTTWLALRAAGVPFRIRAAAGMFGPAVAALLVRLVRREGFADAGLRLIGRGRNGAWRLYLAAYFVPPLLIAASIAFVLLTGAQHWALLDNLNSAARSISAALTKTGTARPAGITADQLALINVIVSIVLAFSLGILVNMLFTFGEEFGWRGYLLPRLAPLGGLQAAIITGVTWGLWHAPLIVLDGYNYPRHPWPGVATMVLFTTALSMIFAWLRFRSGSVWPPVLAHAAFNAQAGFGALLLSRGDSLLSVPIGLPGLVPMIVFAIWLAASGRLRAEADNLSASSVAV